MIQQKKVEAQAAMTEFNSLFIKTCLFTDESQAIRKVRETVFQDEQGISPELEWDGLDEQCIHLVAKLGDKYVGVCRIREIEDAETLKLERLAVLADYRQHGIGGEMVYTAITYGREQGYQQMMIHAQISALRFYERLGFEKIGETFYEADIEHLKMKQSLKESV
jgi:predicted GNAT family N-acyltransferase